MEKTSNLKCSLCRGDVLGWKVVEYERKYLNLKSQSCSHESCSFFGNYGSYVGMLELSVYPTVRPTDVDPSRQSAWRQLEHQREYNDNVSVIKSAMPGAVVLDDYVIDNSDRFLGERDNAGSIESGDELRGGRLRMVCRHRCSGGTFSRCRYLWGENILCLRENDDGRNEDSRDGISDLDIDIVDDAPPNPIRRRRLTLARSHEDQP